MKWIGRALIICAVCLPVSGCGNGDPGGDAGDGMDGGRDSGNSGDGGGDSSTDGADLECNDSLPAGPSCCEGGSRVASADCTGGTWSCENGELCRCGEERQTYVCSDACGSDAFVQPECVDGEWRCPAPSFPTTDCPSGTCWADPGECCEGPSCVDGRWECESIADPC